ncbi:nascent polypeptide-associated complex subunit alpha, muscle-specific form-like [Portunus trituberculatus]|uniref:nascent polypeptide-associated complex subunit alpha, muscle-specific form-like n=1 Tax=Portunus trituberculatus TaxID=210409 RepID=UPI001E1D0876|nr:nascent polypeptide-associated complex subunit alpha, muscle-specific form-like [Portunus trituberculatus]
MLGVGVETVNPQVAMEGRVFPRVPDPSLRGAPRPSPPSSPESLPPRPNASFLWDPRRPPAAAEDSFDAASFLRQHRHLLGRTSPGSPPTPPTPATPTDDLTFEETLFSLRRDARGTPRGTFRGSAASSEELWGPGSLKALKDHTNLQGADSLDSRASLASGESGAPGSALRGYIEARLRRVEEQIRREVATEAAVLGAAHGGADPSLLAALLATRGFMPHAKAGSAPSLGGVSPSAASTFKSHRDPPGAGRRSPAARSSTSSLLRVRGPSPSSSSDRDGPPSLPPLYSRDLSPNGPTPAPASPKSLPPPPPPVLDLPRPPKHPMTPPDHPRPRRKTSAPATPPPEALHHPRTCQSPPCHTRHPRPHRDPPTRHQAPTAPRRPTTPPDTPPHTLPEGTTHLPQGEDKKPLLVPPPRPPAPAPPARPPRPPRPPRPAVAKTGEKKHTGDAAPGPPRCLNVLHALTHHGAPKQHPSPRPRGR